MNIRYGISVNALNLTMLEAFSDAGFECGEMTFNFRLQDRPDADAMLRQGDFLSKRILASGLKLWSVHLPFGDGWDPSLEAETDRLYAVGEMKRLMKGSAEWGAKVIVLHGSFEPVDEERRPERMSACRKSIRTLAECARTHGLKLAVENLPRTCLGRDSQEMLQLTDDGAACGTCFDVNHLLRESHEAYLNRAGETIITTHLSDYDGIDERHWLPGKGIVPWARLYEQMTACGYQGPMLFELRPDPEGRAYSAPLILKAFQMSMASGEQHTR